MHVVVMPLLFALGAGKLTMVLGGAGQGQPRPRLGDRLPRPGPGLARAGPAVAPVTGVRGLRDARARAVLGLVLAAPVSGRLATAGLLGRGVAGRSSAPLVTLTWRDPAVVGPLTPGTVIALALAIGCVAAAVIITVRSRGKDRGTPDGARRPGARPPTWPVPVGPSADWSEPRRARGPEGGTRRGRSAATEYRGGRTAAGVAVAGDPRERSSR